MYRCWRGNAHNSDLGNYCFNGADFSSIGFSYTVINSLFTHNRAIGNGDNPAQAETPGGGYMGAIFFVSSDRTGHRIIEASFLSSNPSDGFETQGYPGIFVLAAKPPPRNKHHYGIRDPTKYDFQVVSIAKPHNLACTSGFCRDVDQDNLMKSVASCFRF